jgi:hypothetical protein
MAKHPRQIIREAVKAQLLAANTAAEDRIRDLSAIPWRRSECPGVSVFTPAEDSDVEYARNTAPRELLRTIRVAIEGAVVVSENLANELDALALEIEHAIDRDERLGGAAADAILESTTTGISREGQEPIGLVQITYQVRYYSRPSDFADPGAMDDFRTADVKTNLGGAVVPGNQTEDRVTVRAT